MGPTQHLFFSIGRGFIIVPPVNTAFKFNLKFAFKLRVSLVPNIFLQSTVENTFFYGL